MVIMDTFSFLYYLVLFFTIIAIIYLLKKNKKSKSTKIRNKEEIYNKDIIRFNDISNKVKEFNNFVFSQLEKYPCYVFRSTIQEHISLLKDYNAKLSNISLKSLKRLPNYERLYFSMKNTIEKYIQFLNNYEREYIYREKKTHADFFNGKLFGHITELNEDQINAILIDEKDNLIIAGPGAGKTRMLVDRVAFYILYKNIPPNGILILAFNNSAVHEVKQRLKEIYNINDVQISTFHSLGFQILRKLNLKDFTSLKVENDNEKTIQRIIKEEKAKNVEFQTKLIEYYSKFRDDTRIMGNNDDINFQNFLLQENKQYETLDGTIVKSIAERDIANFFIEYDIKYLYEPLVSWCDPEIPNLNENGENLNNPKLKKQSIRSYHPDFYLPQYEIYLEHWAIAESGEVPNWFEGNTEDYRRNQQWKREQFIKHKKILWETDYSIWKRNELRNTLKSLFEKHNIQINALSKQEIIQRYFSKKRDIITEMIINTINAAKIYGYTPDSLQSKINQSSKSIQINEFKYFELVILIFKIYELYLKEHNLIDYQDMINLAVDGLAGQNIQNSIIEPYKMICIDEFQDISYQRIRLIQELLRHSPDAHLFCVGDDWQAIYGFAGSSSHYLVKFGDYFSNPNIIYLRYNYRNPSIILNYGQSIIDECYEKTNKTLISTRPNNEFEDLNNFPIVIEHINAYNENDFRQKQIQYVNKKIVDLIDMGADPKKIMILSRFNHGYAELQDLYINSDDKLPLEILKKSEQIKPGLRFCSIHKSKGLEADYIFILNLFKGIYGFPPDRQSLVNLKIINEHLENIDDEERRLMYVAITRARKKVFLITWDKNESPYIDYHYFFQIILNIVFKQDYIVGEVIQNRERSFIIKVDLKYIRDLSFAVPKSQIISYSMDSNGKIEMKCQKWWIDKKKQELLRFCMDF